MRLRAPLCQADTLARPRADEFAVLVEDVDSEINLPVTAQRMQQALADPIEVDGKGIHLTASIGISCHAGEDVDVEALLRWFHPKTGTLSPARLIPIAGESGLIEAIGAWVLLEGCG